MLVFDKCDAQSDALKWGADRLGFDTTLVHNSESALDSYSSEIHHLVIIDGRQTHSFDPSTLCRYIFSLFKSSKSILFNISKVLFKLYLSIKMFNKCIELSIGLTSLWKAKTFTNRLLFCHKINSYECFESKVKWILFCYVFYRSIRNIKGSEYTCIIAIVKKNWAEKEEASVFSLIANGFNRVRAWLWFKFQRKQILITFSHFSGS